MNWIYTETDPLLETIAGVFLMLAIVLLFTRIVGLRSFAKFTAFDFAFTVAIGSVISSTLTSSTTVVHGGIAIGTLLIATLITSFFQKKFKAFSKLTSNAPIALMKGSTIIEENMNRAKISKSQLYAKLREANVLNFGQIKAVVLESTGDISVIHSSDENEDFDETLLEGVQH